MSAADFKEIGNKHLAAKEYDAAIDAYTKAIELSPSEHVFYSNRSAAYLSKGDAQSALNDAEECIRVNSTWAKGYSRKGAALHALKRYEDAVSAYKSGLAIAPQDAGLQSGLNDASRLAESAKSPPAGNPLGGLFSGPGLAKLLSHPKFGPRMLDPDFQAKMRNVQSNPQLLMSDPEMMEVLQVLLGDMGGAAEDMPAPASTPEYKPSPKPAPKPEPEPEVELSEEERDAKKRRVESVAAKDRGNTLYKGRQFTEALQAYDEAYSLDETNIMVLNNKAAVYIELGSYDEALEQCELALSKAGSVKLPFEDRAKVYQRIAAVHLKRNDLAAAIEAYGKAQMENFDRAIERKIKNLELDLKKSQAAAYINPALGLEAKERGNALFRDGKFPDAIKEYEDAIKRDPTNAAYYNNLSAAFLKLGAFNDAKRHVEKSLELDPKYVKAYAKKGDIEFFMKEYHKAMDSYRAGLNIDPDNSLCKSGMQKTAAKIQEANASGQMDSERAAHAMADPEIQAILRDPSIRQVLTDFQDNPKFAQEAMMNDASIRSKIEKLIAAGVLQVA